MMTLLQEEDLINVMILLYTLIRYSWWCLRGYGLLLDISDPANPVRIDAVADSNFATGTLQLSVIQIK